MKSHNDKNKQTKILEAFTPHSNAWCWVLRSELRAEVVMRNKVATGSKHLDKMIQLQRNTADIRHICGLAPVAMTGSHI